MRHVARDKQPHHAPDRRQRGLTWTSCCDNAAIISRSKCFAQTINRIMPSGAVAKFAPFAIPQARDNKQAMTADEHAYSSGSHVAIMWACLRPPAERASLC